MSEFIDWFMQGAWRESLILFGAGVGCLAIAAAIWLWHAIRDAIKKMQAFH
jgi:hypothetical protein